MSAQRLIARLRTLGVSLSVEGDKLKYRSPPGALDAELLGQIKAAKPEIVEILRRAERVQHVVHYVPMRDGVKLAAQVFRPKRGGSVVREPLPAVWCRERSDRPAVVDGATRLDFQPWLLTLMDGGYVVVAVDARGTGASTGEWAAESSPEGIADCYDVTEWLAEQPFCDGNVGMFGDSSSGTAQFFAAGAAPPHLKAIFPSMADFVPSEHPASSPAPVPAGAIAVYQLSGWYDTRVRDAFTWFANLADPQRLVVGPWRQDDRAGLDLAAEHQRWFDQWLKGIDTGMSAKSVIRYFTMGAEPGAEWRETPVWPLRTAHPRELHLHADGGLAETAGPAGEDPGAFDRFGYDASDIDSKALIYTSDPLSADLEVTGHPVVHLFASSSHDDGDFFVYLEEVNAGGVSHHVTEGVLRASQHALAPAPHAYMGLPYHPGGADAPPPWHDEPVELVLDLHPTSKIFAAGSRIRVFVSCRDRDDAPASRRDPAPEIRLHRGGHQPSRIILPVVDTAEDSRS